MKHKALVGAYEGRASVSWKLVLYSSPKDSGLRSVERGTGRRNHFHRDLEHPEITG